MTTDVLIIGSGVAGLAFAIKMAERFPDRQVTLITKSAELESNTRHAQGGIAVVMDTLSDSIETHVNDTLVAGDGLCDPVAVRTIVSEGPERLREVMGWGARFDTQDGHIGLGLEGGHSRHRIVHHRDRTGLELSETLLARVAQLPNISILSGMMAVDLLMDDGSGRCAGVSVADPDGNLKQILSRVTVLATGGAGQVYATTTNPSIATGDGFAMAHRAGAEVRNMEFIQFHPTALRTDGTGAAFLISEVVRGAGARLMDISGNRFMQDAHPMADLAPRDIVARAIFRTMRTTGSDHVLLDCTDIPTEAMHRQFPTIVQHCSPLGIHLPEDPIPVAPAAHYVCGGIATDLHGRTSVSGLFAIGECADTGLHGANRLASNSLLEALVMAHRAHLAAAEELGITLPEIPHTSSEIGTTDLREMRDAVRELMDSHAGIIRNALELQTALHRLDAMAVETEMLHRLGRLSAAGMEVRNMVCVARLIVSHSLKRKENRGGFYSENLERIAVPQKSSHSA